MNTRIYKKNREAEGNKPWVVDDIAVDNTKKTFTITRQIRWQDKNKETVIKSHKVVMGLVDTNDEKKLQIQEYFTNPGFSFAPPNEFRDSQVVNHAFTQEEKNHYEYLQKNYSVGTTKDRFFQNASVNEDDVERYGLKNEFFKISHESEQGRKNREHLRDVFFKLNEGQKLSKNDEKQLGKFLGIIEHSSKEVKNQFNNLVDQTLPETSKTLISNLQKNLSSAPKEKPRLAVRFENWVKENPIKTFIIGAVIALAVIGAIAAVIAVSGGGAAPAVAGVGALLATKTALVPAIITGATLGLAAISATVGAYIHKKKSQRAINSVRSTVDRSHSNDIELTSPVKADKEITNNARLQEQFKPEIPNHNSSVAEDDLLVDNASANTSPSVTPPASPIARRETEYKGEEKSGISYKNK